MFVWTEESAAFWADSGDYTHSYDRLATMAAAHLAPGGTLFEGGCGLGTCPSLWRSRAST